MIDRVLFLTGGMQFAPGFFIIKMQLDIKKTNIV